MHIVTCPDQNYMARAKYGWCRSRTFQISLQSTSNDHYIEWHESSSPTLPTINDIGCEIGNLSNYYSCTVMRCSFRTHFKGAGWSTAIGCKLVLRAGIAGIGCHVSMVLEWQLDIVCAAVPGCCYLLLIAATVSACAMLSWACPIMLCIRLVVLYGVNTQVFNYWSEPEWAPRSALYGWKRYVTVRSTGKFLLCLPATILHAMLCISLVSNPLLAAILSWPFRSCHVKIGPP